MFTKNKRPLYNASLIECISPAFGRSAAFTVNPNSSEGDIFCIFPFFFFLELREVADDNDDVILTIVVVVVVESVLSDFL